MTAAVLEMNSPAPSTAMSLGKRPITLEGEVLRRRIYSPQSYAAVRNLAVVPVVHSECAIFASWFPVVWRRKSQSVEFVTIRALLDDQRAQPPAARHLLPLILNAYPFVLDPSDPIGPEARKMLDDVFADAPTDVGATITTVDRRLSRGTTNRFRFLDGFALDAGLTFDISQAIASLDVFEPWSLAFDIEGRRVEIPDLMVIGPAAFDDGSFAPLLEQYGMPCLRMLSLHRISLFRAGGLLAIARKFIKDGFGVVDTNFHVPITAAAAAQAPIAP
jgi:hypothetical protein